MLKPLIRTAVVAGTQSCCSVTWTLFPGQPDCSAWSHCVQGSRCVICYRSELRHRNTLRVKYSGLNSRGKSTFISSRATKIRFVQVEVMPFAASHDNNHYNDPNFCICFLNALLSVHLLCLLFPAPLPSMVNSHFPFPLTSPFPHFPLPDPSLVSWASGSVADFEMADLPGSICLLRHSRETSR